VAGDDRVAPHVGAGSVGHDRHGTRLEGDGQAAASSDVGAAPAGDDAARSGKVDVVGRRHGDVSGVGIGGNVGESENGDIVRVAASRGVARVADEAGEGAQGAGATVGHGAVARSSQHAVRADGSASAVGRGDGLDPADEGGPAGVRVADAEGHLVRVGGDVGIASANHPRVDRLAQRRRG